MPFNLSAFAVGTALARRQDDTSNAPGLLMGIAGLDPVGVVLAETSIRARRRKKAPPPDADWEGDDPGEVPPAGEGKPPGEPDPLTDAQAQIYLALAAVIQAFASSLGGPDGLIARLTKDDSAQDGVQQTPP
jgi:hypothetical protein